VEQLSVEWADSRNKLYFLFLLYFLLNLFISIITYSFMFVKIHKSYRDVVAICDSELLGKYFEEGECQLDIKESFYKGEEISEEETFEILKNFSVEDATFNIVGEKSINLALKAGVIKEEGIGKIDNIPYALVLM